MSEENDCRSFTDPDAVAPLHERSLAARIGGAVMLAWQPMPVDPPSIASELHSLSSVERVAEVLRYNLLAFEFAVSPQGGLRSWLKLNLLAALVLGVPALLVVPVVTFMLSGFVTWTQLLVVAAENLLRAAVLGVLLILVLVIGGRIILSQISSRGRSRSRSRGRR